jgi:TRAP-type uncharacterized transport system fused permease subunit
VVQEGDRRCKKSTLNDLVHLTPLRMPLMNPPLNTLIKLSPATKCTHYALFSAIQSNPRTAVYIVVVVIGILIIATIVTLTGITDRLSFFPFQWRKEGGGGVLSCACM